MSPAGRQPAARPPAPPAARSTRRPSRRPPTKAATKAARPDFTARVLSAVRRIPPGRVASYGDVAAIAGRPRAARAVGNIMRTCGRPDVPCHRVVAAGGQLGGYGGSENVKRALLIAEGIGFRGKRIANLAKTRIRHRDC